MKFQKYGRRIRFIIVFNVKASIYTCTGFCSFAVRCYICFMIHLNDFKESIAKRELPMVLPLHLKALWYDAAGNWKTAHELIDHLKDQKSAHIHAYLHRKEGDIWNADYWYNKAGKVRPEVSLNDEWEALVTEYLN